MRPVINKNRDYKASTPNGVEQLTVALLLVSGVNSGGRVALIQEVRAIFSPLSVFIGLSAHVMNRENKY